MNNNVIDAYRCTVVNRSMPSAVVSADAARANSSSAKSASLDTFEHTAIPTAEEEYFGSHYSNRKEENRILPDRYYGKELCGNVYYKGGTISYRALLEEAVSSGQYELDETQSMWYNVEKAEELLISSHAKPLYPWSTKLYSEDGSYVYRVENGIITGATRAFYTDESGRKISTRYLAEQLANGVLPIDLDGSWQFLHDVDPELYDKALEIGNAKRHAESQIEEFEAGKVEKNDFWDEIEPLLLLLLGRSGKGLTLREIKNALSDPAFGSLVLGRLGTDEAPKISL